MKPITKFEFEFDGKIYEVNSRYFSKEKNEKLNILTKKICIIKDNKIIFDRENAKEFLLILTDLKRGQLEALSLVELYKFYEKINTKIIEAKRLRSH